MMEARDKALSNPVNQRMIRESYDQVNHKEKINDVKEKENKEMKIKVNGMMCAHCEAHVKKALEAIDGIESAVASHEANLVTITKSKDVDEALIRDAVTEAGYEYAGIE